MVEESMPTFVPGDLITYVVYLAYHGNLKAVKATFRKETRAGLIDDYMFLRWEAGRTGWSEMDLETQLDPPHPGSKGTRRHVAILSNFVHGTETDPPGIYQLDTLEATTYLGKNLEISNPPRARFRIEPEPHTSVLPSSAVLPPTGFYLPEWHPDRPQGE